MADPIVRMTMAADSVTETDLYDLLARVANNIQIVGAKGQMSNLSGRSAKGEPRDDAAQTTSGQTASKFCEPACSDPVHGRAFPKSCRGNAVSLWWREC